MRQRGTSGTNRGQDAGSIRQGPLIRSVGRVPLAPACPTRCASRAHRCVCRASLGACSLSWQASTPSLAAEHRCGSVPKRSEEHTSELQSHSDLVCRLLLEKKKKKKRIEKTCTITA